MRAISHPQRSTLLCIVCLLTTSLTVAYPAQNIITGYAGSSWQFPQDPIAALQAPLGVVQGVAEDSSGNILVTDGNNARIFKIDRQGSLSTFAGNGVFGFAGDGGAATDASLLNPLDVVVDARGNVYFSDSGNCRVRRVDPTGVIDTIAGNGDCGYSGDGGPATAASLGTVLRIALDGASNLYIADPDNQRVRKVSTDGIIRTIAGTGRAGASGDGGQAINARLRFPGGLAVDSDGSLYIADVLNNRIRRIRPDGVIVAVAGGGGPGFSGDGGPATAAKLFQPKSITADRGTLYIADSGNHRIRRVTPDGTISTVAGNGLPGMVGDGGPALKASLNFPSDIAVTARGLFIADHTNFRLRLLTPAGALSTIAGNGNYRFDGDGGLSTSASLVVPTGLAIDPAGNLNVCDNWANRVRSITPFGIINTIAGTSRPGFSGDGGPATAASFSDCRGIAADGSGNLYVADTGNHRIRKIAASGAISTIAGSGDQGFSGDKGPAAAASLDSPEGVAVDASGNVYVVDTGNNRVRRITAAGVIDTIAGSGKAGYTGDGGPAIAATFNSPRRVTVDSAGALYISDNGNSVIRKVTAAGVINTVAGNGKDGFAGDGGPATSAMLSGPVGMAVDASGTLYVADSNNHRVRRISAGVISTFAGNGFAGLGGNGRSPELAALNQPSDVALGADGRIYIADRNGRVRCVLAAPPPLLHLSQKGLTFRATADNANVLPRTLQLSNDNAGKLSFSAIATTTSGGDWLKVATPQGVASDTAPAAIAISVNQAGLAPGNYFGRIQIGSPGAPNSPRLVTVVMNVVPPAEVSGPDVSPAGLVFTGVAGAASPAPQTISIGGSGAASVRFTTAVTVGAGKSWLAATPATGPVTLQSGARITITPDTSGMAAQVSNASLKITFSDGSSRTIQLVLILSPPGSSPAAAKTVRAASDACTPAALSVIPTSLPSGFTAPVSYPVAVEAKVVDNCAQPLVSGSVVATFSNGDPPLSLSSLQNGTWSATWQPRSSAAVTISLNAQTKPQGLKGTATIAGQLQTTVQLPVVSDGGVLNGASLAQDTPVAPGTSLAILGTALADAVAAPSSPPYPNQLGATQVLLGGIAVPLSFTSTGLINGVVPFDVAIGTQEIVIQHQGVLSVPEPVEVDEVGPGVFTVDGSGKGMAVAFDNTSGLTVGSSAPVGAGEVVTLFCTGFGAVEAVKVPGGDPTVQLDAGQAAPLSPAFAASGNVSVNIGGMDADVSFAGITPKSAGLYQVTVTLPPGVSSGSAVPVIVSVDGVAGPAVSIPIK